MVEEFFQEKFFFVQNISKTIIWPQKFIFLKRSRKPQGKRTMSMDSALKSTSDPYLWIFDLACNTKFFRWSKIKRITIIGTVIGLKNIIWKTTQQLEDYSKKSYHNLLYYKVNLFYLNLFRSIYLNQRQFIPTQSILS